MSSTWQAIKRNRWLWLLAVIVIFSGLGQRGPWPADEPRFALVAQQMVHSGDYLFPHRGTEIYPDKPPVLMWLQAGFFKLAGSWDLAFLLPSLCAALGTLWLVFDLSARLFGQRAARISTLTLLLTVQFTYQFKKAQIDPLLVLFVTLSVYGLLRHMLLGPNRKWLYLGAFFAGVGVITKGVGVIALLMFLPYALALRLHAQRLATNQAQRVNPWLSAVVVFAVFLLAIACWLVPVLWQVYLHPSPERLAYLQNILFKQTAQRYANAWHHQQGPLYFPGVILSTWMPLVFVLPWAIKPWWRRLRQRLDARYLLLLGWCACVLLFFSLSKGKRDMYILPVLPMFAVACGPILLRLLRHKGFQALCWSFSLLLALTFFGAGVAALSGEPKFERNFEMNYELSGALDAIWWLFAGVGFAALCASLSLWFRQKSRAGLSAYCTTLTLVWVFVFGVFGYPIMDGTASARLVMQRARVAAGDHSLGLVAWKEQNYLQLQGAKTDFGFLRPFQEQRQLGLAWLAAAPQSRALIVLDQAMGKCLERRDSVNLGQANRRIWWLVRANAVKRDCTDSAPKS
jgi:4-amino-4-deoxy-L-arabinose transferase-like glycosyltransferase